MPIPEDMHRRGAPPTGSRTSRSTISQRSLTSAAELGGSIIGEPMKADGGRFAVLQDPAGAVLALWQDRHETMGRWLYCEPGASCWFELTTEDVEAAADFYGRLFGWTMPSASIAGQPYVVFKNARDQRGRDDVPERSTRSRGHRLDGVLRRRRLRGDDDARAADGRAARPRPRRRAGHGALRQLPGSAGSRLRHPPAEIDEPVGRAGTADASTPGGGGPMILASILSAIFAILSGIVLVRTGSQPVAELAYIFMIISAAAVAASAMWFALARDERQGATRHQRQDRHRHRRVRRARSARPHGAGRRGRSSSRRSWRSCRFAALLLFPPRRHRHEQEHLASRLTARRGQLRGSVASMREHGVIEPAPVAALGLPRDALEAEAAAAR